MAPRSDADGNVDEEGPPPARVLGRHPSEMQTSSARGQVTPVQVPDANRGPFGIAAQRQHYYSFWGVPNIGCVFARRSALSGPTLERVPIPAVEPYQRVTATHAVRGRVAVIFGC